MAAGRDRDLRPVRVPAEGWAFVETDRGSFRLDLCERHLSEMLDGARPA